MKIISMIMALIMALTSLPIFGFVNNDVNVPTAEDVVAGEKAEVLEKALDEAQSALDMPGDGTGNTAADFTSFMLERV